MAPGVNVLRGSASSVLVICKKIFISATSRCQRTTLLPTERSAPNYGEVGRRTLGGVVAYFVRQVALVDATQRTSGQGVHGQCRPESEGGSRPLCAYSPERLHAGRHYRITSTLLNIC